MGRWRPPAEASTAIITAEGMRVLKAELDHLWKTLRPEVVRALSAAAAEGDRSENAEYIYRKKQLAEIDRRVGYLSKRLPSLRVAHEAPSDRGAIYFGAWFAVETDDGRALCHRIVGPDEIDGRRGWISVDSPLARALLSKRVDDEVEVALPGGATRVLIVAVSYEGPVDAA